MADARPAKNPLQAEKRIASSLALLAMTAANKKALANYEGLSVTSIFAIQI